MKLLEANSLKQLLFHILAAIVLAILLILAFFYMYLPSTTNHGETITVPDLEGMSIEEIDKHLTSRNLRYEVNDSSYSEDYPPLTILKQYPNAGEKVKEHRKIFLSVNRVMPPTVPMPDLIDGSLKNAEAVLSSNELKKGKISYEDDLAHNVVLRQYYYEDEIDEGTRIPKGSTIDLVVGNGLGKTSFLVPNYVGGDFEETKFAILGQNLSLGEINFEGDSVGVSLVISGQNPPAGQTINIGDKVDLWVSPAQ